MGYTLNFLGAWEKLKNPSFNVTDYGNIKMESIKNIFQHKNVKTIVQR